MPAGVGPEILLKAFRDGAMKERVLVYGDTAALAYYNDFLGYGVAVRSTTGVADYEPEALNVLDHQPA